MRCWPLAAGILLDSVAPRSFHLAIGQFLKDKKDRPEAKGSQPFQAFNTPMKAPIFF